MRKYLLPSALILLLGLGFALAQTFTRALQLSQDTTGAFQVDSNNNLYIPGHQLTTGPGTPTCTPTASGGACTVVGTDTAGLITNGANSVGVTIAFNKAYLATPYCMVFSQAALATPIAAAAVGFQALITTQVGTSSNVVSYYCSGSK
jgi:hypothetical protein